MRKKGGKREKKRQTLGLLVDPPMSSRAYVCQPGSESTIAQIRTRDGQMSGPAVVAMTDRDPSAMREDCH